MILQWPFEAPQRRLLLLIAAVALIAFFPIGLFQGSTYQVATTIYINPNIARATTGSSDPGAQQVQIQNFVAVAGSEATRQFAANASGLDVSDLRSGLEVTPVGQSNAVLVTLNATDSSAAFTALRSIADSTLRQYGQESLARVSDTLRQYQDQYRNATRVLNDYLRSVNEVDPETKYNAIQQRLIDTQAGAGGGSAGGLQSELNTLQPIVLKFRELQSDQTQLGEIQRDGLSRFLELQTLTTGSSASSDSSAITLTQQSIIVSSLRFAVLSALAITLVAIAVMYLYQILLHRHDWAGSGRKTNDESEDVDSDRTIASSGIPSLAESSLDAPTMPAYDRVQAGLILQPSEKPTPSPRTR